MRQRQVRFLQTEGGLLTPLHGLLCRHPAVLKLAPCPVSADWSPSFCRSSPEVQQVSPSNSLLWPRATHRGRLALGQPQLLLQALLNDLECLQSFLASEPLQMPFLVWSRLLCWFTSCLLLGQVSSFWDHSENSGAGERLCCGPSIVWNCTEPFPCVADMI